MSLFVANGLRKQFGGLVVTNDVRLEVQANEVHAIIGPNGAGKSTLVNLLSGMMKLDAGAIHLDGIDLTHINADRRVTYGLTRCFQVTSIFPRLTVLDNLRLAVQCQSNACHRVHSRRARDTNLTDLAVDIAERVGLGDVLGITAGKLPHGAQRKVDIALALAAKPRLMLLDEPLAGMGPEESVAMVELIAVLKESAAILLIEHDMSAVFKLADRISVLAAGQVIATGTPEEIRSSTEVRTVYLGANTIEPGRGGE